MRQKLYVYGDSRIFQVPGIPGAWGRLPFGIVCLCVYLRQKYYTIIILHYGHNSNMHYGHNATEVIVHYDHNAQKERKMSDFNQTKYINDFIKDKYDTIKIQVPKGQKIIIDNHRKSKGYKSLNSYVNDLIKKDMEQSNERSNQGGVFVIYRMHKINNMQTIQKIKPSAGPIRPDARRII